jgi:hypothetical protein
MVSQVNALREMRGIRGKSVSVGSYRVYGVYRVGRTKRGSDYSWESYTRAHQEVRESEGVGALIESALTTFAFFEADG